jgi:predicted transcriptional regulator YdeE
MRNIGDNIFKSFNDFIIGNEIGRSKYVDVNIDWVSTISQKYAFYTTKCQTESMLNIEIHWQKEMPEKLTTTLNRSVKVFYVIKVNYLH